MIMSYEQLVACGSNKKIRRGFSSVWMAFLWVIWKTRNDRIFKNTDASVDEVLDCIQRLSWQWFLNKGAMNSCLLYEWIWNPCDCMIRWFVASGGFCGLGCVGGRFLACLGQYFVPAIVVLFSLLVVFVALFLALGVSIVLLLAWLVVALVNFLCL
jgi:hypothetical protein